MIITENIKIRINSSNNKYYKSIGYDIKNGQEIEVPIKHLYKGSHSLIHVKCDICEEEKYIEYRNYIKSSNLYGYYSCSPKCSQYKNRLTNLKKYGYTNPSQSDIIKEKTIKTNLEKYGFKYYLQTEDKKEKTIKTNLKKYGFDSHNKSIDVKNKKIQTCLKNYNVKNPSQSNIIKKQKIKTSLKNYGVEYPSQTKEIKEKTKMTNLMLYGYESPQQNKKIKEKIENTNLIRYGNRNPFQNEIIKEKIKKTNIKKYGCEHYKQSNFFKKQYIKNYFNKYGILPNDKNLKFKQYRNVVKNLTLNNKKILIENWNGYDFYDGEYIKDNFNLKFYDKNYPTIDHKISVYYGFINNIPAEEISRIENLCITKKSLNSKKNKKCYEGKKES